MSTDGRKSLAMKVSATEHAQFVAVARADGKTISQGLRAAIEMYTAEVIADTADDREEAGRA
jgi:hypothetical protein